MKICPACKANHDRKTKLCDTCSNKQAARNRRYRQRLATRQQVDTLLTELNVKHDEIGQIIAELNAFLAKSIK